MPMVAPAPRRRLRPRRARRVAWMAPTEGTVVPIGMVGFYQGMREAAIATGRATTASGMPTVTTGTAMPTATGTAMPTVTTATATITEAARRRHTEAVRRRHIEAARRRRRTMTIGATTGRAAHLLPTAARLRRMAVRRRLTAARRRQPTAARHHDTTMIARGTMTGTGAVLRSTTGTGAVLLRTTTDASMTVEADMTIADLLAARRRQSAAAVLA